MPTTQSDKKKKKKKMIIHHVQSAISHCTTLRRRDFMSKCNRTIKYIVSCDNNSFVFSPHNISNSVGGLGTSQEPEDLASTHRLLHSTECLCVFSVFHCNITSCGSSFHHLNRTVFWFTLSYERNKLLGFLTNSQRILRSQTYVAVIIGFPDERQRRVS